MRPLPKPIWLGVTILAFLGALLSLLPILFVHDVTKIALSMASRFYFAELAIKPMWAVPMDLDSAHARPASAS